MMSLWLAAWLTSAPSLFAVQGGVWQTSSAHGWETVVLYQPPVSVATLRPYVSLRTARIGPQWGVGLGRAWTW